MIICIAFPAISPKYVYGHWDTHINQWADTGYNCKADCAHPKCDESTWLRLCSFVRERPVFGARSIWVDADYKELSMLIEKTLGPRNLNQVYIL